MFDQVMPRYLPIDTYDAENPVLFINTHQALSDMSACAMHRFTVVRDLTDTLSSLNLKDISDCDLTRITRAVHLLTREGCAVLDVIQARLLQREEGFKTAMQRCSAVATDAVAHIAHNSCGEGACPRWGAQRP